MLVETEELHTDLKSKLYEAISTVPDAGCDAVAWLRKCEAEFAVEV